VQTALVDHHPIEPATGYRVERSGIVVAISGDTRVCEGIRKLAHGAHVIIHEALLGDRVSPSLLEWNASAESVGELAWLIQPRTLVLTHLIPAPTTESDRASYVTQARRGGFNGTIIVAEDLTRIECPGP
jgi:ribonuclease Z